MMSRECGFEYNPLGTKTKSLETVYDSISPFGDVSVEKKNIHVFENNVTPEKRTSFNTYG